MRRPAQRDPESSVAAGTLVRFVACSAALALVACTSNVPQAGGIVGRYSDSLAARDSPSWRGVVGRWITEYQADGEFFVHQTGGMWIRGRYTLDGDALTIRDLDGTGSCTHFGTDYASARYRVHLTSSELRFEVLRDECLPRRFGMTAHPWRRIP